MKASGSYFLINKCLASLVKQDDSSLVKRYYYWLWIRMSLIGIIILSSFTLDASVGLHCEPEIYPL